MVGKEVDVERLVDCITSATEAVSVIIQSVWGHQGEFIHDTGNTNTWSFRMKTGPNASESQRCSGTTVNLYRYNRIEGEPQYVGDCPEVEGEAQRRIWKVQLRDSDTEPDPGTEYEGTNGRFEFDDDNLKWEWKMMVLGEENGDPVEKEWTVDLLDLTVEPTFIGYHEGGVTEPYRKWKVTKKP